MTVLTNSIVVLTKTPHGSPLVRVRRHRADSDPDFGGLLEARAQRGRIPPHELPPGT